MGSDDFAGCAKSTLMLTMRTHHRDARRRDREKHHSLALVQGGCWADAVTPDYVAAMASSTSSDARPGGPKISADLQDVADRIHEEFAGRFDLREVDECLGRVAAKFNDAKVRAFVPLLVRRFVRDELHERLRDEPDDRLEGA